MFTPLLMVRGELRSKDILYLLLRNFDKQWMIALEFYVNIIYVLSMKSKLGDYDFI